MFELCYVRPCLKKREGSGEVLERSEVLEEEMKEKEYTGCKIHHNPHWMTIKIEGEIVGAYCLECYVLFLNENISILKEKG